MANVRFKYMIEVQTHNITQRYHFATRDQANEALIALGAARNIRRMTIGEVDLKDDRWVSVSERFLLNNNKNERDFC